MIFDKLKHVLKKQTKEDDVVIRKSILEDKSFILSAIQYGINKKRLHSSYNLEMYEKVLNTYFGLDDCEVFIKDEKPGITFFTLLKDNEKIGCAMLCYFSCYVEIMYIYVIEEYQHKNFGKRFHINLENQIPSGTKIVLRCYRTSTEGIHLAERMGFRQCDDSTGNTITFEKYK